MRAGDLFRILPSYAAIQGFRVRRIGGVDDPTAESGNRETDADMRSEFLPNDSTLAEDERPHCHKKWYEKQ